jgi:hypothetical protein
MGTYIWATCIVLLCSSCRQRQVLKHSAGDEEEDDDDDEVFILLRTTSMRNRSWEVGGSLADAESGTWPRAPSDVVSPRSGAISVVVRFASASHWERWCCCLGEARVDGIISSGTWSFRPCDFVRASNSKTVYGPALVQPLKDIVATRASLPELRRLRRLCAGAHGEGGPFGDCWRWVIRTWASTVVSGFPFGSRAHTICRTRCRSHP